MPATRQTDTIKLSHMNEPTEKNQPFLSSSADSILFLFHKMALYLLMFDHLDNLQCSHCSNPYKSPCSLFSAPWPPFWFWLCARGERPLPFPISGYVHLKFHVLSLFTTHESLLHHVVLSFFNFHSAKSWVICDLDCSYTLLAIKQISFVYCRI